jgi:RecB family exonuclease
LKVWCAIDFAYTDPRGGLRIIDWKTGAEKAEALQIQLGCYALYACEKWHANPETVKLEGVFLGENARVSDYSTDSDMLIQTKDLILTSAAQMREPLLDVTANTAAEKDFPCCENDRVCRWCNYREVCPYIQGA